jgi:hypothetical protein
MAEQFSPTYEDKSRGVADVSRDSNYEYEVNVSIDDTNSTTKELSLESAERADVGVDIASGGSAKLVLQWYATDAFNTRVGREALSSNVEGAAVFTSDKCPSPHVQLEVQNDSGANGNTTSGTYDYTFAITLS